MNIISIKLGDLLMHYGSVKVTFCVFFRQFQPSSNA